MLYTALLLKTNAIYILKPIKTTFEINSDRFGIQINSLVCGDISFFMQVIETQDTRHLQVHLLL